MTTHVLNNARPTMEFHELQLKGAIQSGDTVVMPTEDKISTIQAVCQGIGLDVTVRLRKPGESNPEDWTF